jgi:twinkle protein
VKEPDFVSADLVDYTIAPLTARGISVEAARRYGYGVGTFKGSPCHVANWYDDAGKVVGQKIRTPSREFFTLGKVEGLYGRTRMKQGGKMVVITEGELDALAVSDVLGNSWPVVSVPHGVDSAVKWIKKDIKWLETFERVVLCFDADEFGQKAIEACRTLFTPGKCHIAALTRKDPCDYLAAGDAGQLVRAIWDAQKWTPAGIVTGDALLKAALTKPQRVACGWPWPALDEKMMGLRYQELGMVVSGTGSGKSTFCRRMAAHFLGNGLSVGYLALEEEPRTTTLGIYSVHAKENLTVAEDPDEDKIKSAHFEWGNKLYAFDHFGSTGTDDLLDSVRYMIVGLGCKIVILDHISIAVSGLDVDERKGLDIIMTRLRTLVQETGALLIAVSHLRRGQGTPHEEGGEISLQDIRSTQGIAQMSNFVIALERNQQHDDETERNMVKVRVLKNRHTGKTGLAGKLFYNFQTGDLENVTQDGEF